VRNHDAAEPIPFMSDQDRDHSCVDRLCAGDMKALEELYDRHSPLLYSLVLRIVGRTHDAEEVLQDTWLQAWRRADAYDPGRGAVGAWLLTLARSRAIDRLRSMGSRQRAERAAEADPRPVIEEASVLATQRQLQMKVTEALGALAPRQREVLELGYYGGLSQSEIAARLGAPLGTVKSWTRQALMRLRDLVPQEDWS
jgi:RNA polymerase sigma-70 factor (ECF subfamily)